MNLNQLKCFRALARHEHYTRTAEELNMTQSSLSRMIAALEDELGVYLFEKQGRNIRLTPRGRQFYDYVCTGLGQIEQGVQVLRESADPEGGVIDFGFIYALSPVFIPPRIKAFRELTGDRISLRFHQGNSRNILPKILDGSYDLGICSWMDGFPKLRFLPLIRQEYILLVGADHPLAGRERVTLKDAAEYDFILPLDETNYVENLFQAQGLVPRVSGRVEEDHAAAALVSVGMGCAILPRNPVLDQYGVKQISLFPEPLYRDFYLVSRKNARLSPAAGKLYAFLKDGQGSPGAGE